ncbi:MAG: S8 family serine peptidase [Desulfovibrionaceae bacterium]
MRVFLLALCLVASCCLLHVDPALADRISGEALAQLKDGADLESFAREAEDLGITVKTVLSKPIAGRGFYTVLLTSDSMDVPTMIDALSGLKSVRRAVPNSAHRKRSLPNDPGFPGQWGLRNTGRVLDGLTLTAGADIGADDAWKTTTGSSSVVVAVADSGVQYDHPDLAGNMWINPNPGIDGAYDGVYGADFAANDSGDNDNDPMDIDGHGTHVAGIIGARGNNGEGVAGVDWSVRLLVIKLQRPNEDFADSDVIEGLNYILAKKILRGVNIVAVNGSFGGLGKNPIVLDMLKLLGPAGVVWVAAAGNDAHDNDADPMKEYVSSSDLPGVISVAAMDGADDPAEFSHWGAHTVDLGAPGNYINSTYLGSSYQALSGTSMAAPHVTGVIGLLAATYPDETAWTRIRRILSGVTPVASLNGKVLTEGRLNAANSLEADLDLGPFAVNASQATGMTPGTKVTLEGFGFGASAGTLAFTDNQLHLKSARIASWSSQSVAGYVPEEAGKYVGVRVGAARSNSLELTAWAPRAESSYTHAGAAGVALDGELYLFGGQTSDTQASAKAERYNPQSNTWITLADMPAPRAWGAAAVWNGKVYVLGGTDFSSLYATAAVYDPETGAWSTAAAPNLALNGTAAVTVGDDIYVLGGADASNDDSKKIYRYSPSSESSTQVGELATPRRFHAATAVGNKIYVFGGREDGEPLRSYEIFDTQDNSVDGGGMPINATHCSAVAMDDEIIIGQGLWWENAKTPTTEPITQVFDTGALAWSNKTGTIEQPLWHRYGGPTLYIPGRGVYLAGGSMYATEETPLNTLDFLATGPDVSPAPIQPVSGQTVTMTGEDVSYDPMEALRPQYALPQGRDKFSDVVSFNATVSKSGELAAFQYKFTAPKAVRTNSLTLHKLFDANGTSASMAYAASAADYGDGKWWLSNDTASYINKTASLLSNATYAVNVVIRDNGAFDQDRSSGKIWDPQLLSAPGSSDSSSGGCVLNPASDWAWDALAPAAGLLAWALVTALRRRKQ